MSGAMIAKTSLDKRGGASKARRRYVSVMKPECMELILRIIIGKKDLKVIKAQTEYPIKSLQGRGVRFDVFARDSKDREYDIEIQRAKDGAEPKRARYNSTLMDANALKSGEDFGKLRDTMLATAKRLLANGKLMLQYTHCA